jgi:hypothetical protein
MPAELARRTESPLLKPAWRIGLTGRYLNQVKGLIERLG